LELKSKREVSYSPSDSLLFVDFRVLLLPFTLTIFPSCPSFGSSWNTLQNTNSVLVSNPILESFGNARTVRNDNSSRFGKLIELQFKQTGSLIGATINTYLLEKVRLVHQAESERTFHIFYEVLAASTRQEREMFSLNEYTANDFKMTNQSGTYHRRDGVDDSKQYDDLLFSMGTMGVEDNVQQDIIRVICAFLHASNLTFGVHPVDDSARVDETNRHLEPVLGLLGLEKAAFTAALTEYEIEVGNQTYRRPFAIDGAENALQAFIKGTYAALFSFIVQNVNRHIDCKKSTAAGVDASTHVASISVLDIFGFESFQCNSFEQLCINYCNEALQQQFNRFIFKSEQEEYQREGS
jgi:myosin V